MEPDAALLIAHWPLSRAVVGDRLRSFPGRTVVAVAAAEGRFLLKAQAMDEGGREQRARSLAALPFLAQRGYAHAPRLLATRAGASHVYHEGVFASVMELIPGREPPPTPASFAALGAAVAGLNAYTDFPHAYPLAVTAVIGELEQRAGAYPFRDEFLALVATLPPLASQPAALIHGEISLANTVLGDDGVLRLVDWDEAGSGPRALDPGYPLIAAFLSVEDLAFDRDGAAAFYHAYAGGRGMTMTEKDGVFAAAVLHALRYLSYDTARRWRRLQRAVTDRERLLAAIPSR